MMVSITTTRNRPKPFSWSFSKLRNFETCPRRHWHVDIARDVKDEEGEALLWGNAVHKSLAARIANNAPLPDSMKGFEKWCEKLTNGPGTILVEQKLAITRDLTHCDYYSDDAWFRGIGDVIKVAGRVALTADWKTGKLLEESNQLVLMAACVFARYPDVQRVRSEFIWLKEDATTRADFSRSDMPQMWKAIWPRIQLLENAHNTTSYPAKPGGLCKRYCPVTSCPHHGE